MEELAINGGKPAKRKPFPDWPLYDGREIEAVTEVIRSRKWWRNVGTQTTKFEQEFAAHHLARHALAVTNGTQAIELALAAADIGRGDEVIVPAFSFISTASAVLFVNAVPIFVDVLPDTYCIDPAAIAAAITSRTRAIIPVHLAGQMADMDAILDIAHHHDLLVIEDAAHAPCAEWKGRPAGTFHTAGTFSFQAAKLVSAGEGGLIMSNDADFIQRCLLISNCGRAQGDRTYQHVALGTNCRMSELHAAALRVQLTRLNQQIDIREANSALLDRMLGMSECIQPQALDPRVTRHPHYMYMFRYDAAGFGGLPRGQFVDALNAEGVPAFIAYPPIYRTPVFRERSFGARWRSDFSLLPDYTKTHCPVAEEIGEKVVWLHHRTLLGDEEDMVELVEAINKIRANSTRAGIAAGDYL
jgi:3-amino-5-hydroxybenzoate synthase